MSYFEMDHAGWVQAQIEGTRRGSEHWDAAGKRRAAKGIGWEGAPASLLQWQRQAFDVLGVAGNGIYNAPISWNRLEWSRYCLSLIWRGYLATWDSRPLTLLVLGMHTARLRCDIEAASRGYFRFYIHPRSAHGGIAERHPNLEEAIADWNSRITADHPLRARRDPEQRSAA